MPERTPQSHMGEGCAEAGDAAVQATLPTRGDGVWAPPLVRDFTPICGAKT